MPQSAIMPPALIAIDWGSSSFRAYLMSGEAEVLDEVASGDGIGSVEAGAYPATLTRLVGRWLDAHAVSPGHRLGHGRQPAWLARGGLRQMSRRAARRRFAACRGRGRRPAGRARSGTLVCRRRRTAGCDAGRGDGNLRNRRFRRPPHCVAGIAFEMGEGRGRARRRVQDLRHRGIVRRPARSHRPRRFCSRRAG